MAAAAARVADCGGPAVGAGVCGAAAAGAAGSGGSEKKSFYSLYTEEVT